MPAARMSVIPCMLIVACFAARAVGGGEELSGANQCLTCHGMADLWEKDTLHLYVRAEDLAGDAHSQAGVRCQQCHGGNAQATELRQAHASEDGFRKVQSPLDIPGFCGRCHDEPLRTYSQSAHGQRPRSSGLVSPPVCSTCHGTHGIFKAADPRSTLLTTRVAEVCTACHPDPGERLAASVHGRGDGPGQLSQSAAPGDVAHRTPSCTDCHQGHDPPRPQSVAFRNQQPDRCGSCHCAQASRYGLSMHGALTELGYAAGAKCSDCHGSHGILPVSHPQSLVSPSNRRNTCAQCHPGLSVGLLTFDPHADHTNRARFPFLFWTYRGLLVFLCCVFGFFGAHSILWFFRGLIEVARHGRPAALRPGAAAYIRFRPAHRVAHTVIVVSFLGLALTGLPLKFSHHDWAQRLAHFLGGFSSTGLWHRLCSLSMFGCFLFCGCLVLQWFRAARKQGLSRRQILFGPDSLLLNPRDFQDMARMVRWFLGRGSKPTFERWAYWEKCDFWGACADTILIGASGLVLWFPGLFCRILPGEAVNVAQVVHSTLALLATGFVFAIHFFGTHLRPDRFPMDMSVLTGLVSEEEWRHERPEYWERLQRERKLEELCAEGPRRWELWLTWFAGMVALAVGLALLAGMLWTALGLQPIS